MTEVTNAPVDGPAVPRSRNQTKFIIGGAVIVLAVIFLILTSIGGSTAFYMTIAELQQRGEDLEGRKVRVIGVVEGNSIQWDEKNLNLQFEIHDDSGKLTVIYHGIRPDMLQEGAEAVVEGEFSGDSLFEASTLMLKCPSKYEEAATAEARDR